MKELLLYFGLTVGPSYLPQQYCEHDRGLTCCADEPIRVEKVIGGDRGQYWSARVVLSGKTGPNGGVVYKTPTFCRMDWTGKIFDAELDDAWRSN